ncbi:hypothetical protein R1flu_013581 [Riccia fluitans]|uniref:Uncharacterized protein n=1 Tax=Riccia fluitans TaxID=41844 RepID=A0ABD1YDY6_9MARC
MGRRSWELLAEVKDADGREDKMTGTRLSQRDFQDENQRESKGNCSDLLVEANVTPDDESRGSDLPEETLIDVWNRVCTALQNRPATQALTKQKGNLISIVRYSDSMSVVKMGASALFVKKFQQHEHASALEAAFTAVLKQPIKLDVLILDTNDKKH